MTKTPCVEDDGLEARIPGLGVRVITFVQAYHRLDGDLDALQKGFDLEPWELYATMAYYCANKELFDTEHERIREQQRQYWEKHNANEDARKAWTDIHGALRGDETDEEVNAALERLS